MDKNNKKSSKIMNVIPKIARMIGEQTGDSACAWFICQPKMPDCMKKENKEK